MRRTALLGLLLGVAACNVVTTAAPMFTKADEAGAPRLKPGVWAADTTRDCVFDPRSPADTWPACADGVVVGQGTLGGYDKKNGASEFTRTDYILAGGDPVILQIHDVPGAAQGQGTAGYFYATLRPVKTDDNGLVTAFGAWPVLCGPPPPQNAMKDGQIVFGTLQPVSGMTMDKDGDDCSTDKVDALRAAAASEEWEAGDITNLHWIRDGER